MAQDFDYNKPLDGQLLTTAPELYRNQFQALASNFSGTAFPSTPVDGQVCFRTDLGVDGQLYEYTGNPAVGLAGWRSLGDNAEVITARGTKSSLDGRLDVSLNEDGTLKDSVALNNSEWVTTALADTFVNTTTFTVVGDQTDIFLIDRRLKINLGASIAKSHVINSSFGGGITTVTINDGVLDGTLVSVQPSLASPLASGGSITAKMVGAVDEDFTNATYLNISRDESIVLNFPSDADFTLTTNHNTHGRIEMTDTGVVLSTTRNVIVDNTEHNEFIFINTTLVNLTVKTLTGAGILVPAGSAIKLRNDTVNIINVDVSGGGQSFQSPIQNHVIVTSSQSLTGEVRAEITNLNATITPSSTESRIRVSVRWSGEGSNVSNHDTVFGIRRDSTDVGNPDAAGDRPVGIGIIYQGFHDPEASTTPDSCFYEYIDSPNSVSPINYKATILVPSSRTMYNNRTVSDSDQSGRERLTSTIILEEVGA